MFVYFLYHIVAQFRFSDTNASFFFSLGPSAPSVPSVCDQGMFVFFRLFVFVNLFRLLMLSFFFLFRSFGSFGSAKCVTDNFFFSFVFSLLHSVLFCF